MWCDKNFVFSKNKKGRFHNKSRCSLFVWVPEGKALVPAIWSECHTFLSCPNHVPVPGMQHRSDIEFNSVKLNDQIFWSFEQNYDCNLDRHSFSTDTHKTTYSLNKDVITCNMVSWRVVLPTLSSRIPSMIMSSGLYIYMYCGKLGRLKAGSHGSVWEGDSLWSMGRSHFALLLVLPFSRQTLTQCVCESLPAV